jgi:hypothetical protein
MMAVEAAPAAFDMDQPDDPGQEGPRVFHLT